MLFQQCFGDVALITCTDAATVSLGNQAIVIQLSDIGTTLYFCYGQCCRVLTKTYIGTSLVYVARNVVTMFAQLLLAT